MIDGNQQGDFGSEAQVYIVKSAREATRALIMQANKQIRISTYAFEYLPSVEDMLREATQEKKVKIDVYITHPQSPEILNPKHPSEIAKRVQHLKDMGVNVHYSMGRIPFRGTIIDDKNGLAIDYGGKSFERDRDESIRLIPIKGSLLRIAKDCLEHLAVEDERSFLDRSSTFQTVTQGGGLPEKTAEKAATPSDPSPLSLKSVILLSSASVATILVLMFLRGSAELTALAAAAILGIGSQIVYSRKKAVNSG